MSCLVRPGHVGSSPVQSGQFEQPPHVEGVFLFTIKALSYSLWAVKNMKINGERHRNTRAIHRQPGNPR